MGRINDGDLAAILNRMMSPLNWEEVILDHYAEAHMDWAHANQLVFGKNFFMYVDQPKKGKNKKWPYTTDTATHHYLFKDAVNATAFVLTFG